MFAIDRAKLLEKLDEEIAKRTDGDLRTQAVVAGLQIAISDVLLAEEVKP